jgi:hypothetical protein
MASHCTASPGLFDLALNDRISLPQARLLYCMNHVYLVVKLQSNPWLLRLSHDRLQPHHEGPVLLKQKESPLHKREPVSWMEDCRSRPARPVLATFYPGRARVNRQRRLNPRFELGVGITRSSVWMRFSFLTNRLGCRAVARRRRPARNATGMGRDVCRCMLDTA